MNSGSSKAALLDAAHKSHWVSRVAFPVVNLLFYLVEAALAVAVYKSWFWLAVLLALVASHLMHGMLIGFHEASHGMLRKNRSLNDLDGILIGLFSFMSFTLYRAAHQTHHAFLGTERDEELWPFVVPNASRPARIAAAILELTFGLFFTPFLFIRTFLRAGSPIRSKKVRARIWIELIGMLVAWIMILSAVAWFGVWKYFLWMYGVPGFLAANFQSWRKYIEHVGLCGSSVRGATRSIIAKGWFGRLVSFTLLHEPYHGVHHLHAGIPHAELPERASELMPVSPDDPPPFSSYSHALIHLIRNLGNPRVGAQWRITSGREF